MTIIDPALIALFQICQQAHGKPRSKPLDIGAVLTKSLSCSTLPTTQQAPQQPSTMETVPALAL
ncbi:hypothetical protein [Paracoccus benzoatiresistens]|uniref:Uncharacterized protein n=1 Tax=Paracoccus benzoatiresistens TaxID=2997341 RepID=A0ABT4J9U4_9RHOB|nr:hypothetical protein [Paracoccus sp. EF6]MCZ0963904.1 hypothetical protein [Paracoccus sp. EF6]